MTDEELIEKIKSCTFVIVDSEKHAVAVKDIPEGFLLVAKASEDDAEKIVSIAGQQKKLVVESLEDVNDMFDRIDAGVPFNSMDDFLIDIMEEFRLIKTGSKIALNKLN